MAGSTMEGVGGKGVGAAAVVDRPAVRICTPRQMLSGCGSWPHPASGRGRGRRRRRRPTDRITVRDDEDILSATQQ